MVCRRLTTSTLLSQNKLKKNVSKLNLQLRWIHKMTLHDKRVADAATLCQCGRRLGNTHCPYCGSFAVYRTPSRDFDPDHDIGLQSNVNRAYHCKRCGENFHDHRRLQCTAPAVSVIERAKQVASTIDAQALIAGLRNRRQNKEEPS